jgi:hypothetical protein
MNKQFQYIILIFSAISISFIFYFVLNVFKTKGASIQKENWKQDTSIVLTNYIYLPEPQISQKENWRRDTTIVLKNGIYQLELQTIVLDDTLSKEWVEYGFLSPLIRNQYFIFIKNGEIIKKYTTPIKKVRKENSKHKKVALVSVPVFEICLLKGDSIEVYKIYGANYCCGLGCPEFTGFYSMEGEIIHECSPANKYFWGKSITDFLTKHKIDINKPVICNSIFDIFTIEE